VVLGKPVEEGHVILEVHAKPVEEQIEDLDKEITNLKATRSQFILDGAPTQTIEKEIGELEAKMDLLRLPQKLERRKETRKRLALEGQPAEGLVRLDDEIQELEAEILRHSGGETGATPRKSASADCCASRPHSPSPLHTGSSVTCWEAARRATTSPRESGDDRATTSPQATTTTASPPQPHGHQNAGMDDDTAIQMALHESQTACAPQPEPEPEPEPAAVTPSIPTLQRRLAGSQATKQLLESMGKPTDELDFEIAQLISMIPRDEAAGLVAASPTEPVAAYVCEGLPPPPYTYSGRP
jgi:hypothetical protein